MFVIATMLHILIMRFCFIALHQEDAAAANADSTLSHLICNAVLFSRFPRGPCLAWTPAPRRWLRARPSAARAGHAR